MKLTLALTAAAALLAAPLLTNGAAAQGPAADARMRQAQDRFDREYQIFRGELDRYQSARPGYRAPAGGGGYRVAPNVPYDDRYDRPTYSDERDEGDYDAARYYRSGPNYRDRTLASDERVYAGQDGRYYCRRADGTTGLILGAGAGGILGNIIDGGRSRTVGTLLGGAAGALAGRSIEQNSVRCR
ncbi:glycine zipper 2TM domain-containing protein [uncultured Sphingomonas sp.]|uniref:glycine zipper 2TM domain-containing protein n=1 Tax=uncultured Sphingomonas sp. TaxID=158754 RepID=UPI0035CBE4A9